MVALCSPTSFLCRAGRLTTISINVAWPLTITIHRGLMRQRTNAPSGAIRIPSVRIISAIQLRTLNRTLERR